MLANFEKREYEGKERVWVGRYQNLHNLPHWHLEDELICVEEGETTISHNHQEYHLKKGEAIFLDSGEIHFIKSGEDCIVGISLFDSTIVQDISRKYRLASAKLEHSYPILQWFDKIKQEQDEKKPFYEQQVCADIMTLIIEIFRGETLEIKNGTHESSSIENFKNLLDEIEEKYSYITFSEAASFMGLSEPYFSKFFRKTSGMTFSRYLNIVRVEKAIQILNKDEQKRSTTEVTAECGFGTIRNFNRIFKDITGMTPRQLPSDYVLDIQPIRNIKDAFNPTLQSSVLL